MSASRDPSPTITGATPESATREAFRAGRQSIVNELADAFAAMNISTSKRDLVMAAFRAALSGINRGDVPKATVQGEVS